MAEVREESEKLPVEDEPGQTAPLQSASKRNWKRSALAAASILVVAGVWLALGRTPKVESLLITPFQVIGQSPELEVLQLGLQDSLAMELSSFSSFAVIKSNGMPEDVAELGRRHRARFVLTGTVESNSERIHVNARLLWSTNGQTVWVRGFDETMDDIYKVQLRLAALTVADVIPSLPLADRGLLERRHPVNGVAFHYYLLGRYYWNKRDQNGAGYGLAFDMFQKSIETDPAYAPAYIGIADTFLIGSPPGTDLMTKALPPARALQKAVQFDPKLGEAHTSLAMIAESYDFDWNRAERELQTAIRLAPNYVTAHHWYAEFLTMTGQFEQSEAEFEATRNLDPASAIVLTDFAQLQNFERKYEQALRTLDEVLKLDTTFALAQERKGYALMMLRHPREALAEFEMADRLSGRETAACLKAWAAAVGGEREQAVRFAHQAEEQKEPPMMLGVIWGELGDLERAMNWLEQACEQRNGGMISMKVNPIFDPLRKSERFKALLRRMNLG